MSEQPDAAVVAEPPESRPGISVDWVAVAVAGVIALLAALRWLPAVPWDTVTIPLVK